MCSYFSWPSNVLIFHVLLYWFCLFLLGCVLQDNHPNPPKKKTTTTTMFIVFFFTMVFVGPQKIPTTKKTTSLGPPGQALRFGGVQLRGPRDHHELRRGAAGHRALGTRWGLQGKAQEGHLGQAPGRPGKNLRISIYIWAEHRNFGIL